MLTFSSTMGAAHATLSRCCLATEHAMHAQLFRVPHRSYCFPYHTTIISTMWRLLHVSASCLGLTLPSVFARAASRGTTAPQTLPVTLTCFPGSQRPHPTEVMVDVSPSPHVRLNKKANGQIELWVNGTSVFVADSLCSHPVQRGGPNLGAADADILWP
ncbi:hypothetical protein K466DRAFT_10774 [Polyporus arcularius HHB13444]|uniref:Uncharacterized protein n=1 Tax=Polyporus arcularius HHB13444 TaxID=1314778 RepID=A0A5C3NQE7_9APHY|nr:hypothetical protein K466DRAFT_10774 [Polyporus arcularius HHB13444]